MSEYCHEFVALFGGCSEWTSGIVNGTKGGLSGFILLFTLCIGAVVGFWKLVSLSSVLISCFAC